MPKHLRDHFTFFSERYDITLSSKGILPERQKYQIPTNIVLKLKIFQSKQLLQHSYQKQLFNELISASNSYKIPGENKLPTSFFHCSVE